MNKTTTMLGDGTSNLNPARMGDMTLKQVRSFLAASTYSTFWQAAQQVFLSQPAFSRVIQELESSLGEELFVRTKQGVKLSAAGEAFLPHAQQLMACYSATVTGMAKWRSARQGQFLLAGSHVVMPTVLPILLNRIRINFEVPSLRYEDGTSQQVIASVVQGRADCGVCTVLTEQPELHCTTLLEAPLGLLASPSFPWPSRIDSLQDIEALNLTRYSDDSVISGLLKLQAKPLDAYFTSRVVCSNIPAAYAMVQGGQIAAIASGFGATHPQAKGLRFVPLPGLLPILSVSLFSKRDALVDQQRALMKELTRLSVLEAQWHPSVKRHASAGQVDLASEKWTL